MSNINRNGSGYYDPTAFEVMKTSAEEEERFHKLLCTIKYICNLADFDIDERIILTDRRTGRTWR
ncbi:MAG: hypothetical protein LUE29_09700 [Lachnospiraceae bacterium]|nr:hypothetical protein [Lachnospiraceae bacterium]